MQVNIIIGSVDPSGKKINTTVSWVNPNATNEQLTMLASKLNALTTGRYASTTKETKEEL